MAILKRYRFPFKPAYWDILALSAWGILFIYYRVTNQLRLLIHPRYYWAVVLAGVVLLGLAIAKTFVTVTNTTPPSRGQHFKTLPGNLSSMLLLGIAMLGLVAQIQPLGSQAALQEGYTVVGLPTRPQVQRFTSGARPEDRTLSDWARTLAVYPEPDSYAGKTVNVSGFVVHPPELPDNIFMITRFVIRHCALDATPVGLPVILEQRRSEYPQDSWLAIQGQMETLEVDGARRVAVAPTALTSIPEPEDPYEY